MHLKISWTKVDSKSKHLKRISQHNFIIPFIKINSKRPLFDINIICHRNKCVHFFHSLLPKYFALVCTLCCCWAENVKKNFTKSFMVTKGILSLAFFFFFSLSRKCSFESPRISLHNEFNFRKIVLSSILKFLV